MIQYKIEKSEFNSNLFSYPGTKRGNMSELTDKLKDLQGRVASALEYL
jgi:hypothetical protein